METPVQRRTSAKSAPSGKPAGVPSSAFDLGAIVQQQHESAGTGREMQAAPAGESITGDGTGEALPPIVDKARPAPLDPAACRVLKGRPLPIAIRGDFGAKSRAKQLLDRLQPGDSVDLSKRHAMSVAACAKKNKIRVAVRKLGADTYGVWRLPDAK